MKAILAIGLLLIPCATATEVRLRVPRELGGGKTLPVSAYSQTTPVELTFEEEHDVAAGDTIYCFGMRGNPKLRGHLRVQSVLSPVSITVRDLAGNPIPGTTGAGIDIDAAHDGVQLGFCGKVVPIGLRDHPRSIWPIQGSAEDLRSRDPDGSGPLVAPAATEDAAGWAYLTSRNDPIASPAGCDGRTPALCPVEENVAKAAPDRVAFGYGVAMLAFGWRMDATKENWKNAAIYYLNNIHRYFPPGRPYDGFTGVAVQSEGDDTDYASFGLAGYGWAYSLLRAELTEQERSDFARKVWNDNRSGCRNKLSDFQGRLTGDGTALTTPDAGDLQEGDLIQVKTAIRQYRVSDGDLLDITVTGTSAVARFAEGVPMPRTGTVKISNSGVQGLDGWYAGTISGQTLTFTTTAAPGTYANPAMELMSPGAANDRIRFHWLRVLSVDRTATPHVVNVNTAASTVAYNSPWGKISRGWQSDVCGIVWLNNHHESHDIFQNIRTAKPAANMTISQNFINVSADSWPELADLEPPYTLRVGPGEIVLVTAKEPENRRLIVERGYNWTVPTAQTTASVLLYTPDAGSFISISSVEAEMITGSYRENKVNSTIPPLMVVAMAMADDAEEARAYLEHFWSLYTDYYFRIQKRLFTASNYAGPANLGYAFGRWAEFTTQLTVAALNSFVTPLDLRYSAQRDVLEWAYSLSRPGAKNTHVAWGDSGTDRFFEKDELVTLWCASYLYPDAPETWRALDYYDREWGWLEGTAPEEWIIYRLLYTPLSSRRQDYTTGPLARVFHEKEPGLNSISGGMHSRTSWSDPQATMVWAPLVMGGDHNGAYPYPGLVILSKGATDLISGSTSTGASTGDTRTQYGVQVLKTNGVTVLTGQNSALSLPNILLQSGAPAGGGVVELISDSNFVTVPRYVTVPEGAKSAPAPVRFYQTPVAVTARISLRGVNEIGAYQRANATTGTVSPQPAAVGSVSIPGPVTAGHYIEGTLTLVAAAPAGGVEVALSTDHPGVHVPPSIRFRQGQSTTQFFVSAQPGATGEFRVTASSLDSVTSAAAGIVEANPLPVTVVNFGVAGNDTAQGGLRVDGHGRNLARWKIGPDFAYMRADNSDSYEKTADTADVAEAHRDLLHLKPEGAQDYLLTYDRLLHSKLGHQDILRIPYNGASHFYGDKLQVPPAEYQRSGAEANFISREYGVRVNSRVLLPADPSLLVDDSSTIYATRLTAYTGQELESEMMAVHQACSNTTCQPPQWRLIASSEGHRAVQIDDAQRTWIVAFTKGTKAVVSSFNLNAEPYAGTATFVITGLTSVKPFTKYSVMRDGVAILEEAEVGVDGTLRFTSTYGAGGAFTVTSTGAAPVEILTHSFPQGTTGAPYTSGLSGMGGVPPYSWSVATGSLCAGLSLAGSSIVGTPTQAGTCSFSLRLTDQNNSFVERSYSITVKAPAMALVISTNDVPGTGIGEPYSTALSALGGEPPYSWSLASGTLPEGVSLGINGVLSGTPAQEGDFPFTARVTDSHGTAAQKAFELRVSVTPLVLESEALPVGFAQTPYETQLSASGGLAPYAWSIASGELPPGLDLLPSGLLHGVSAKGWNGMVTIRVQDWTGRTQERSFGLTVRNNAGQLGAALVAAGKTKLAVRYGRYGLSSSQPCLLELSENPGLQPVLESRTESGRHALRTVVFGESVPLTPGRTYYFHAVCGSESIQKQWTTRPAGTGTQRAVWLQAHPVNLGAGETLHAEYGPTQALGHSTELACSTTCVASLPGTSGEMLYHRTVVKDSAGRIVRRGEIRTTVPE